MPTPTFDAVRLKTNIPAQLIDLRRWVIFSRDRENRKPPFQTNGRLAASTKPAHWVSFEEAVTAVWQQVPCRHPAKKDAPAFVGQPEGIGFVFDPNDGYCGIDLDDCLDDAGQPTTEAQRIISDLNSYTEITPSGKGLHVIVKARKPGSNSKNESVPGMKAFEMYDSGRYFTMTGAHLPHYLRTIEPRQAEIDALYGAMWPGKKSQAPAPPAAGFPGTDAELIANIAASKQGPKFTKLWAGDCNGYTSQSSADFALMCILAFWTANDTERMERLFGMSKLGARDKWTGRSDYRADTIRNAIDATLTVWTAGGGRKSREVLILDTVEEIRQRFTIAIDAAGQIYRYDENAGLYLCDDGKAFSNMLMERFSANAKPLAMGDGDRDKMLLHLSLGATREFWKEPPVDRINVRNGILNLDTLELAAHTPDFLHPNQFDVDWDPEAECPGMDNFLGEILPADEVVCFYEILGYCLAPDLDRQVAFLLKGTGSNGKSQFLAVLRFMIGQRNYAAVPLHKLEGNAFAAHQLVGKLVNIDADMSAEKLPGSRMFKAITGGDDVDVERKYQDGHRVKLYARLVISSNWFPRSADNSNGFFRRWHVLLFDKKDFRDDGANGTERIDPSKLLPPLLAEAPGILRKAVLAYKEVRNRGGFRITKRMSAARAEFRAMTDSLSVWLDENTLTGDGVKVRQHDLRAAYDRFCRDNNYPPLGEKDFSFRVTSHRAGITTGRSHGAHYFIGIGLRAQDQYAPPDGDRAQEKRMAEQMSLKDAKS